MDDQHVPHDSGGTTDATGDALPHSAGDGGGGDRLLELRAALDTVDDLPLEERAAVFERTHAIVTDELRALELG